MAGFVASSSTQTLGTGAGTGGTGLTVTKTSCTAGDLLVVRFTIWRSTNTDPGTVTASGWTTGPQQAESASARHRTGWLFLPNCGSGSQSAVLAWTGAGDCTAAIDEYSGMFAATLSGTAGNSATNSPFSTGNATSSATGGLAIAVIGDDGSNTTYTISDSKNSRGGRNPSPDLPALLGSDLLVTVSTTNSGAWTSSPTNVPGNAAYAVGVLLPGPSGGPVVGAIQPGQTWRRNYWLGLQHPFPGATSAGPAASVVAATDAVASNSDTATRATLTRTRSGADTIAAVSDVPTRLVAGARTSSDSSAALADTATRLLASPRTVTDTAVALTDAATRSAQAFIRTSADTSAALTDVASRLTAASRTAADTASAITDAATRAAQALQRTAADTQAALSDVATRAAQHLARTAADSIAAITDAAAATTSGAHAATVAALDTLVAITDAATRALQHLTRTGADSQGQVTDAATRTTAQARSASDSQAAVTDAATRNTAAPRSAADTLATIVDAPTRAAQAVARSAADVLVALLDVATRLPSNVGSAVKGPTRLLGGAMNVLRGLVGRNRQDGGGPNRMGGG